MLREHHAVGRERQIADRRLLRKHADELRQIAAQQGLATGESDAIDAGAREQIDERAHFLEMQNVLTRKPRILGLWHAVTAPQIASVRDRQPQIPERAAKQIVHAIARS